MDQYLDPIRDALEGQIDFEGQRLAEQITTILLSVTGVICFLVGFVASNIYYTLYVGLAGTALTFLIVVPPMPYFNRHPRKWLPPRHGFSGISINVDGQTVS